MTSAERYWRIMMAEDFWGGYEWANADFLARLWYEEAIFYYG